MELTDISGKEWLWWSVINQRWFESPMDSTEPQVVKAVSTGNVYIRLHDTLHGWNWVIVGGDPNSKLVQGELFDDY